MSDNSIVNIGELDKNDVFKYFTRLFSNYSKKIKLADWWTNELYDIASQIFCFSDSNIPIYDKFPYTGIVAKIIKEKFSNVAFWKWISSWLLLDFRRYFYSHPEVKKDLLCVLYNEENIIPWFNIFLNECVELKIYDDKDLRELKDYKYFFFSKKQKIQPNSETRWLESDLYSFFEMDRYDEERVWKWEVDKLIKEIADRIESWEIEDPRKYTSLNWRDLFPDDLIEKFEKLNLKNYNHWDEVVNAVNRIDFSKVRKALWFTPKWRQRYFLIFQSRENHIANSRRSWKTLLLMYISLRQIFIPWQMVLYIIPTKEWFSDQPFFYAEKFFENAKLMWIDTSLFGFNSKDFRIVNKELKSKILFLSAQGSSWGRSFATNLCIIDEAAYISNEVMYDVAYTSTTDKKGSTIASSTINIDMPLNWFFYKKIELDWMDDAKCFSVDLYNNPFWTEKEKKRIEEKYRYKKPLVRNCEYMAIFNTEWSWFQIDKFFKVDFSYDVIRIKWIDLNIKNNLDVYSRFMLCQDPAKTMDKCGMALIWVKWWGSCELICSWYVEIKDYILQTEFFIEFREWIIKKTKKIVDISVDVGKWWAVLLDFYKSKWIFVYGVLFTWWDNHNKKSPRELNVPRSTMEKMLIAAIAEQKIIWYSRLDAIRNEFETYDAANERKMADKKVKHHNDVIAALMMWVWVLYERRHISFRVWKEHDEERLDKVMSSFDPQVGNIDKWNWIWYKWWGKFLY